LSFFRHRLIKTQPQLVLQIVRSAVRSIYSFSSNKSPARCNSFPVYRLDVCLQLNDCSGSLWFYLCIVVIAVLCLWSGRPDHNTKVKPEAATAVIELLMMGGRTPETC